MLKKIFFTYIFLFFGVATGADNSTNKLSKEINFEDLLIKGKYHFSDEAITTVEQDKVLNSLISVRKDFKDRIKKSRSRQ